MVGERMDLSMVFCFKCLFVSMCMYIYEYAHRSQFLRFVIAIVKVLMVGKCPKQEVKLNFYSSSLTERL